MIERVLIVGFGSIGQRHLRIVRESLPLADVRLLRRHSSGDIIGANGSFTSLGEALDFKPHLAVIANPAPLHVESAIALVRVGCNLLVEKPLSATTEGVTTLLAAARERGVVLQVGYNLRFQPSLREFRSQVQSGLVGRILSVRCETGQHLDGWRPSTDYRNGVSARHELGGGVLLELSHEIDYLRWIFGEVQWISAWIGKQSSLEIDVEDTVHLLMGMTDNNWTHGSNGPVAALSLDFIRHDSVRRCTAIGESGSLTWDDNLGLVQLCTAEGSFNTLFQQRPVRDQTFRDQWGHFLDCVNGGKTPMVSGEDGLAVLELIQAARQSFSNECARVQILSA